MIAPVLIVGAGPTGLVLALGLERQGIPFRIIDKNEGPGAASRAIVVHARTLEFYRQLGVAEELIQRGIVIQEVSIYKDRKLKGKVEFGHMGTGLSPYPYVLNLPQDEHEKILVNQLKEKGIFVEWGTELLSFRQEQDFVCAVTAKQGVVEEGHYAYMCGCDGSHSSVRKGLGLDFAGGTYEQVFYVADVLSSTQDVGLKLNFYEKGFVITMPVRTKGSLRLIGLVPQVLIDTKKDIEFRDLTPYIAKNIGINVQKVNWFSTYRIHHRVSEHFQQGRVFIAGDAAHVHSPAGGQGMNTGIGDAMNLSWKLAAVIKGKAKKGILHTYESERRAFAKVLVSTTDKMFERIVGKGLTTKVIRELIIPYVLPVVSSSSLFKKTLFKTVSQIRIHYRDSMLSKGSAGAIHGGDRLPWIPTAGSDNFKPLQSFDSQFHVYGEATHALRELSVESKITLYEFPWTTSMKDAGMVRGSLFLIRPDGYVAFADSIQDIENIKLYLKNTQAIGT